MKNRRQKNPATSFRQLVNDTKTVRQLEELKIQRARSERITGKKKGMM